MSTEEVQSEHIRAHLATELERTSPGNADKHRRNLLVWWNWLEDEGDRDDNPMRKVKNFGFGLGLTPAVADAVTMTADRITGLPAVIRRGPPGGGEQR